MRLLPARRAIEPARRAVGPVTDLGADLRRPTTPRAPRAGRCRCRPRRPAPVVRRRDAGVEERAELVALDVGERDSLADGIRPAPGRPDPAAARRRGHRRRDARGSSPPWLAAAGGTTERPLRRLAEGGRPELSRRPRGSTASTTSGPSVTVTPTPCRGRWAARTPNGPPPPPGAGSSALRASEPSPGSARPLRNAGRRFTIWPISFDSRTRDAPAGGGTPRTARTPRPGRRRRRRTAPAPPRPRGPDTRPGPDAVASDAPRPRPRRRARGTTAGPRRGRRGRCAARRQGRSRPAPPGWGRPTTPKRAFR